MHLGRLAGMNVTVARLRSLWDRLTPCVMSSVTGRRASAQRRAKGVGASATSASEQGGIRFIEFELVEANQHSVRGSSLLT
jgi:hypothetical protein